MTNKEINKLQYYIGKRQQGQTDEQIIAHIEKINKQTPLTDEEWRKLFFPVCANADITIFNYLLSKVTQITDVKELVLHTLRFRNPKYERRNLKPFLNYNRFDVEVMSGDTSTNLSAFLRRCFCSAQGLI